MLVISAVEGEFVTVGQSVVRVLDVQGCKVILGFEAPQEIRVLRQVVAERMGAECGVVRVGEEKYRDASGDLFGPAGLAERIYDGRVRMD